MDKPLLGLFLQSLSHKLVGSMLHLFGLLGLLGCQSRSTDWDEDTLQQLASSPEQLERFTNTLPAEQQDLLLLTLAVRNPQKANTFCKKVRSQTAKEKCQQVIGRPHLQLSEPQPNDVQVQGKQ